VHSIPDTTPTEPTRQPISRRSLLRGGAAVGLTALTTTGLGSSPAAAAPAPRTRPRDSAAHLVPNYQPSQPTGWPWTPGQTFSTTIGGHTSAKDFTFNGKPHRISLLPSSHPGGSSDPTYEDFPSDPAVNFEQTLADAFGAYYSFHYVGGFPGRKEFNVQSYSVFVREPTATDPTTGFGADIYVVYEPDHRRGDPAIRDNLQWIQVVRQGDMKMVDDFWRANPWYLYGGLTSIYGNEVFNFRDAPQTNIVGDLTLEIEFVAETFLVQDTGTRDAAGRDVIKIFGGMKWGWHVQQVQQLQPQGPPTAARPLADPAGLPGNAEETAGAAA
jgi:hypothetical protein